ncbi:hypothetical protein QUA13_10275 [Microcoleus sp. S28C3]|uniref:hypothetical protein n=1 Tax=unclassified Microcoleus TaxID=2642155 RepID=UPI002FD6D217
MRWLLCDARNDRNEASVGFRSGCHGVLGDTPREQPSRRESTKIINAVRKQGTSDINSGNTGMMGSGESGVGECGIIELNFIIPMQPETR